MQDKQTNKPPSVLSIKTYDDLEVAYLEHLKSGNKSEQDIKNFRSTLNSWREVFKADNNSPVISQLGEKFSVSLEKYKANQLKNGAKNSTIASKASNLKKLNEFLTANQSLADLSPNFGERLQQLIRNAGFEINQKFWELYLKGKTSPQVINSWCRGAKYPHNKSQELVIGLEKIFKVPSGTLTSLLRSTHYQKKVVRKQTVWGKRVQVDRTNLYKVWDENLEKELQGLVKFKTDSVGQRGLKRNKNAIWTSSEGGELPTAKITQEQLQSFFGYLCLPIDSSEPTLRGLGYSNDKLTLGLLAVEGLVENYILGFRKLRSFNKYNNGHLLFLGIVTSLLRPETGYLYQSPQFAVKIGMSGDTEGWQKRCFDTRTRLVEIHTDIKRAKNSGNSDFQKGRDPKEPIADILALPNPLTVIKDLISIMLSDVNSFQPGAHRATFYRDILLIALLVSNPLRIKMFTIMKFGRNLIRDEKGSWWIKFKREDFKNRRSLASDYEVEIAPEFYPLIERYQREFRPLLFGAEKTDYVFLKGSNAINRKDLPEDAVSREDLPKDPPSKKYKPKPAAKDIHCFNSQALSERITIRIKAYFPLNPGFRAHAFRHIVATSIIKSNPEMGFFLAAKVLHDKLETVEKEYAHIEMSEFFRPYNRFLSDLLKGVINEDGTGKPFSENGGGGK